ncbi:MAG: hypothetical protein Q4D91_13080 [Lautropia sp.]|nr:hypothetical protein [Lautropia sp.]
MKTITHRISALAIAMLLFAALVGYSPTSHAGGCGYYDPGTKFQEQLIYGNVPGIGNTLIGKLSLYYSSVYKGTNIACLTHEGIAYNVPLHTAVKIWRCAAPPKPGSNGCAHTDAFHEDIGRRYKQIAGAVQVTGTRDRCVIVYGHIQVPGTKRVKIVVMKPTGCLFATEPQVINGTLP